jgi:CheY-like chemotaxis protein
MEGKILSTTVLVAEDEALIAMDVMDELGSAGFIAIGPFARSAEALEYCRRRRPDCAVLDVRLADGESFPVADWLAENGVPVVFHSAHALKSDLMARYPRTRVLPKPTLASQLVLTVAELCRNRIVAHSAA